MSSPTTQITLRTAVLIPFLLIFLFAIGVIIFVQKQSYEEVVTDISNKQLTVLTEGVHDHLNDYLRKPFAAVQALGHSASFHNLFHPNNTTDIESYLLSAFQDLYSSIPQLDVIAFGSITGDFAGFRREANGEYTLMIQDKRTKGNLAIYNGKTQNSGLRSVISQYDPRVRPWYTPVAETHQPTWSPIYANADERQEITLSAMTPVFEHGDFAGVLVADVRINTFNAFLRELQQNTKASVFIMDEDHRLVAQSSAGSVVSWGTKFTHKGQRLLAKESSDPIIQNSASRISELALNSTSQPYTFQLDLSGERLFSRMTPYTDDYGLTWFIGITVSESDLVGTLPNSQRKSWFVGLLVTLLGMSSTWFIFNRVTRPINATASAAQNLAKGNWDGSMPRPGYVYETTTLVHAFNEMANNLKVSFKALREQLIHDPLTRLYSRQGLIEMSCTMPSQIGGRVYLLGVNRFRDINDSVGHHNGDQLLLRIAERLDQQFGDEFILARIGGDEFAIYAPNLQKEEEVRLTVRRVQQVFDSPFLCADETVIMNIAIGVVETQPEHQMQQWLRNASIALNYAKQETHSGVCYYSPEMASASKFRTQMIAKIQQGIEQEEFIPYYQSIIDLSSGEVVGAEALARWHSADGVVSPLDFIALAEESGMIKQIGHQILLKACQETQAAIEGGRWHKDFQLHVNVSVNQLSCPEFIADVADVLSQTGLCAQNLTLEITESRIVGGDPTTLDNMLKLREMNVGIAIDDFGTGYSSLAYLDSLPFTCLKIDRTFTNRLNPNNLENSVFAAIITITKGLKANVVAEGVETAEQARLLRLLGCTQVQGFYYSRPLPIEEWPTHLVNMK